jgi:pimeloyl-ACP methyl ester carboxylesterase
VSPQFKKVFTNAMIVLAVILILWLIIAPLVLTFRIADENARQHFADKGLELKVMDLKSNKRNIHYVITGNDSLPTLVFLHGSPSSWKTFIEFMDDPRLLQKYRMVGVDRPGFGGSDFGDAVDLQEQARLILLVIKKVGNGKPLYLVGHSLGGPLEIKLAANLPDTINGLMVIAGSMDPALEPKEKWRNFIDRFPFKYFIPGAFRPSNTELLFFKKDIVDLAADFPKVTCEVWLVHGEKDTWVPPGNSEYAKQKLVNARKIELVMLPGGDHFIPWTKKNEIVDLILEMGKP